MHFVNAMPDPGSPTEITDWDRWSKQKGPILRMAYGFASKKESNCLS